jgi:hypothetical protein
MANVYKVSILKIEPAAGGSVYADALVQIRTATTPVVTWGDILNGHRTIVLEAADIITIYNDPLNNTAAKRRQAINDKIKSKALEFGIDVADEAYGLMNGLYTFPFDVTIRGV